MRFFWLACSWVVLDHIHLPWYLYFCRYCPHWDLVAVRLHSFLLYITSHPLPLMCIHFLPSLLLSSALECKLDNHSVASAQGYSTTWFENYLCLLYWNSWELFRLSSTSSGSVDFKPLMTNVEPRALLVVTLVLLKVDICSLPFQNHTLESVTLCFGQNCSNVLIPC